jgi:hypothetical protein
MVLVPKAIVMILLKDTLVFRDLFGILLSALARKRKEQAYPPVVIVAYTDAL